MGDVVSMQGEEKRPLWEGVDVATRARAGSLAAHGLTDVAIADVLLLSLEQVKSCRESEEFKVKYAEVAKEQIDRQIDLAEGWDAVEEKAVQAVLESLQYNRDPKYALAAANVANKAERRKQIRDTAPAIDASKAAGGTNIIVLKLNQNFITSQRGDESAKIIDVTPIDKSLIPRKQVDLPTPKAVEEFLAPVKDGKKDEMMTEFERQLQLAGVSITINDTDEK